MQTSRSGGVSLLRANDYPAGSTELTPDTDALKQIGFNEKPAVK